MECGIFIKGRLVGIKNGFNIKKGTGERFDYVALGIDIPFVNSFQMQTSMVKEIRISTDKQKDAAFMKSLEENYLAVVELQIGVGDFRNLFVSKDAVLNILEPAQQQAS